MLMPLRRDILLPLIHDDAYTLSRCFRYHFPRCCHADDYDGAIFSLHDMLPVDDTPLLPPMLTLTH